MDKKEILSLIETKSSRLEYRPGQGYAVYLPVYKTDFQSAEPGNRYTIWDPVSWPVFGHLYRW